MRFTPAFVLAAVFAAVLVSAPVPAQQKGGEDFTGPYDAVPNFPEHIAPKGYTWGSQAGVFAESPNRIFIASRGELLLPAIPPAAYNGYYGTIDDKQTMNGASRRETPPDVMRNCIVVVDGNGKVLESWTQWDHLFVGGGDAELGRGPHAIKISPYDPARRVWVVDDVRQQVFVFSNDGKKLLMTLGVAGVAGEDDKHFGRPTDIAFLPDGSFVVSDGYTNTRVVKFDKNGKYLMAWGTKGSGPGQFNGPHGIAADKNGRVYVSDRGNHRIQVFDENGKFLDQWPDIRSPFAIYMSGDQHLWVADGATDKFIEYDLNGKFLYAWGNHGTTPGTFWAVHGFSVDSDGNLYAAETYGGRTQKLRPKPGADPSKLVGVPVPLMAKTPA
jgi:sugar lactone lactonase YvrE